MIIKCKRIQCGSRLWLEMEIDCEKNNGPPTAKHYDANHEWETQFIDFRYFSNQHMRLILAQWKSSAKKFAFYTKNKYDLFFLISFLLVFINNLKRFFCVCPKQTTKSVNVSSAEQQHNKGVRWRRGRWRSGKNRRARAEFIIQLSPFPTDWRGLSCVCVCGKFALIFLLISPPALSGSVCSPHSIPHPLSHSSTVCLVRPCSCCALFLYISNGTRAINCKQSERERQWVG